MVEQQTIVLIKQVFFGERESHIYLQYLLPKYSSPEGSFKRWGLRVHGIGN